MTDSTGKTVKITRPGMAVTVSGWKSLPKAGDEVLNGTESDVKKALANRVRQSQIVASLADVDAINAVRKEERERKQAETSSNNQALPTMPKLDGPKELKLIIKADVSGSAEAVEGALQGIGNKEAKAKIVSSSVGDVTESDVLMAKAVNGKTLRVYCSPLAHSTSISSYHCCFLCYRPSSCGDSCSTERRPNNQISYHLSVDGGCSTAGGCAIAYDQRNKSHWRSFSPSIV